MNILAVRKLPKTLAFLVALLPAIQTVAIGETRVGEIQSVEGPVTFDAYATGKFIAAMPGDALFEQSVIKTGFEGRAELLIGGERFTIPPDTEARIETLLESRRKQRKVGWLSSFIKYVGRWVSSSWKEEETAVLGGRASKSEASTDFWVTEDDVFLVKARELIAEEDYAEALEMLEAIQFAPEDALPGEVEYLKGHLYYSMGFYEEATWHLGNADFEIEKSGYNFSEIPFYTLLHFERASSHYFSGDYDMSQSILTVLIQGGPGELEPYALLMLAQVLREAGNITESRRLAEEALGSYRGTPFEADFSVLADEGE
ncbi:MAG: hypothetical protein CMN78_00245 [Spirochaetales bacterium]|nr:hypothetical protein [Spirochaetales bacterium]